LCACFLNRLLAVGTQRLALANGRHFASGRAAANACWFASGVLCFLFISFIFNSFHL